MTGEAAHSNSAPSTAASGAGGAARFPPAIRPVEWAMLAAAILFAAWLRLPDLNQFPVGMSQDEVIRGYDAWCVWRTGRDHRGVRMPAFTECFGPGDFPAAPTVYLTAPFVGLLGLAPQTVRLPVALLGVLTIPLLWWWVRREFGAAAAAAAALSLAISPWHVLLTRFAFEAGATPFLVTACLAWLVRGRDGGRCARGGSPTRAAAAGLALGVALWIYPSPRAVVPLLVLAWLAIAWMARRRDEGATGRRVAATGGDVAKGSMDVAPVRTRSGRLATAFILGGLLGAAPLIATLATHPGRTFARFSQLGMQRQGDLAGAVGQFARQYCAHFDPRHLFWPGEPRTAIFKSDYKFVHVIEAPLLIAGLVSLWRRRRASRPAAFVLLWLLLFPLPAALARDVAPHEIRSLMGMPVLSIVSGVGAAFVFELLARGGRQTPRVAAFVLLLGAAASALAYRNFYRDVLPSRMAAFMQADLLPAFDWLRVQGGPFDAGFVTYPTNQGFCYYLFGARVEPSAAQSAPVRREPWALGFEYVGQFGPMYFAPPPQLGPPWGDETILAAAGGLPAGARVIMLARPGQSSLGRLLHKVDGVCGTPGVELREYVLPQ